MIVYETQCNDNAPCLGFMEAKMHYKTPYKKLKVPADLEVFRQSRAFHGIYGFILELNKIVQGKDITEYGEQRSKVCKTHGANVGSPSTSHSLRQGPIAPCS